MVATPAGTSRYRSLWLTGGEGAASVEYKIRLSEGADVSLHLYFIPSVPQVGKDEDSIFKVAEVAAAQELVKEKLTKSNPELTGSVELNGSGACVLVVDNSASWFAAKAVTYQLTSA